MAGLAKEYWIPYFIGIHDEFYKNDKFLNLGVNMNQFVDGDAINFAMEGPMNIDIHKNRDVTEALPIKLPNDKSLIVKLDEYATDQMQIPTRWLMERSYDVRTKFFSKTRLALKNSIATEGMHNIGPQTNTAFTPIVQTDSGNPVSDDGLRTVTKKDLVKMRKAVDKAYPGLTDAPWWIVMDVDSYWDLVEADPILASQVGFSREIGKILGKSQIIKEYAGFNIMSDKRVPRYTAAGAKRAYGATPTAGDLFGLPVFVENMSFYTALGTTLIFGQEGTDAGLQSELRSFNTRAYVGGRSNDSANWKHIGAILRTRP